MIEMPAQVFRNKSSQSAHHCQVLTASLSVKSWPARCEVSVAVGVQEITRLYILPFGEKNFLQLTIHARVNRDGVERLHRAQAVEINRHILSLDRACDHRHPAAARAESAAFSRSSCCMV